MMGRRSDRYAEIAAGLEAGERVLLRRPEAGEVVSEPWDSGELAAVGLMIDGEGRVVSKQTADAGAAAAEAKDRPEAIRRGP